MRTSILNSQHPNNLTGFNTIYFFLLKAPLPHFYKYFHQSFNTKKTLKADFILKSLKLQSSNKNLSVFLVS